MSELEPPWIGVIFGGMLTHYKHFYFAYMWWHMTVHELLRSVPFNRATQNKKYIYMKQQFITWQIYKLGRKSRYYCVYLKIVSSTGVKLKAEVDSAHRIFLYGRQSQIVYDEVKVLAKTPQLQIVFTFNQVNIFDFFFFTIPL